MTLWDEGRAQFEHDLRTKGVDQNLINAFLKERTTYEDARDHCLKIKKDADKKYGDVVVSDVKVPTSWIATVMDNMATVMQVGDYLVKGAPESVGLAWWAVKQVLGGLQNNYKLYGFFGSSLANITEAMVLISTIDRMYDERKKMEWKATEVVNELLKYIRSVYAAILDFSYSVRKHIKGGTWDRFKHAFKDIIGTDLVKFETKMVGIEALKKKIREASGVAFQEKSFKQTDEIKGLITSLQAAQQRSITDNHETRQYLLELKQEMAKASKPLTRMDWAKRKFEENKKLLHPIPHSQTGLAAYKDRTVGTCEWIFEQDAFKAWYDGTEAPVLEIAGQQDTGKSFLTARIFDQITADYGESAEYCIHALSCQHIAQGSSEDSSSGESGFLKLRDTLISDLYDIAGNTDSEDALTLEKCNETFANPRRKKVSTNLSKDKKEDTVPDLDEALTHIAKLLNKKLIIVLDGVDRLAEESQTSLLHAFDEIKDQKDVNIRILVTTRPGSKIDNTLRSQETPTILADNNNRNDIALAVKQELDKRPTWTQAERELAVKEVATKAGFSFKYAIKVAIPYLSQPWQRPLDNHLRNLPEGLNESYEQWARGLSNNYLELLKTALIWSLDSARMPTVTEVMDAYSQIYLLNDACGATEEDDKKLDPFEFSQFDIEQLREVGGPFFDVVKWRGAWYVKLTDIEAVKNYVYRPEKLSAQPHDPNHLCKNCRNHTGHTQTLFLTEKGVHLTMALTIVRHYNSQLFQRRYLKPDDPVETSEDVAESKPADNEDSAEERKSEEPTANGTSEHDLADGEESKEKTGVQTNGDAVVIAETPKNGDNIPADEKPEDEYDPDDSVDSEDRDYDPWPKVTNSDSPVDDEDWYDGQRYEIDYWGYHFRRVEKYLPEEEREHNEEWQALMMETDKMIANKLLFEKWQSTCDNHVLPTAIHAFTFTAVTSVVSRLLEREPDFDINTTFDGGRTLLHLAEYSAFRTKILKLLLERGADPNLESESYIPPFHFWILTQPDDVEAFNLFLKHGASVVKQNRWKFNALQYYAWAGNKPEILDLLLDTTKEEIDINVKDEIGETPLHKLLARRDIPIPLLEKYLARGADVNIDDNDSQRPLYELAGTGALDALKAILPHVTDVDDDDHRKRTALHDSAWAGQLEAVKLLVEKGADPLRVDKHDRTAFFYACLGNSCETVDYLLSLLLERGAKIEDINKITKRKRTPLRQAAAHGFFDAVEKILEHLPQGVKDDGINLADVKKGRTALHCAALRGRDKVVQLLITKGADISTAGSDGKSALVLCSEQWALDGGSGYEAVAEALIDADTAGFTYKNELSLLNAAAVNGSVRILRKLNSLGVDINQPDQWGWTPLLLAKRLRRTEAVAYLETHLGNLAARPAQLVIRPALGKNKDGPDERFTVSDDGLIIGCKEEWVEQICFYANHPIPAGTNTFYYEMSVLDAEPETSYPIVAIGLSTHAMPKAIEFPGWPHRSPNVSSWGYHGDDGNLFCSLNPSPDYAGERYGPGDTVGCGVELDDGEDGGKLFYTKNGVRLETEFHNVKGRLFPIIGFRNQITIELNFGTDLVNKPFNYQRTPEKKEDEAVGSEEAKMNGDGTHTPVPAALVRRSTVL